MDGGRGGGYGGYGGYGKGKGGRLEHTGQNFKPSDAYVLHRLPVAMCWCMLLLFQLLPASSIPWSPQMHIPHPHAHPLPTATPHTTIYK